MIEKPFILLSVIIPIYNVDKYLRKCLTTCLSHNNAIEYILVDDGSTDDSLKIAKDYTKAYKNIVVIHQKNMGLSAARNTGLKSATFEKPSSVDSCIICADTGKIATTGCTNTYTEYFLKSTTPGLCDKHAGSQLQENKTNTKTTTPNKEETIQGNTQDIDVVDPQQVEVP